MEKKPKFDQLSKKLETPIDQESYKFAIEKYPTENGFIYELYFSTEAEAREAVGAFWNAREDSEMTRRGLRSGMLQPFEHEITDGDRTTSREANASDLAKHPEKPFIVQFNGNTGALRPEGEAALRKLGFIE